MHARLIRRLPGPLLLGAWYPVGESSTTRTAVLAVNGRRRRVNRAHLEFDDRKREWASYGVQLEPEPMAIIVCPAGHHLQDLAGVATSRIRCPRCVRDYDVLPEPVITGAPDTAESVARVARITDSVSPRAMARRDRKGAV